jgi:hypothetical protein
MTAWVDLFEGSAWTTLTTGEVPMSQHWVELAHSAGMMTAFS